MKTQRYKDPRPAEIFAEFHERARTNDPDGTYDVARLITTPISLALYRARAVGAANVPAGGPVILAANHFSAYDHFLVGAWLRRKIRFMAKSQLYGNPVIDWILRHGGAFPVRRGHADEEAFKTVHAILGRAGCMLIYCEGGRSRSGELGSARPGVGRAALESGAPVVPVTIHGSQRIRRLALPAVTIDYGAPLRFDPVPNPSREEQQEVADRVFSVITTRYEEFERDGRAAVIRRARGTGALTRVGDREQGRRR